MEQNTEKLEDMISAKIKEIMKMSDEEWAGFTYDTPLFDKDSQQGFCMGLDSLGTLELAVALYEKWGVDVPMEDMADFNTVNSIADYVRKHLEQ